MKIPKRGAALAVVGLIAGVLTGGALAATPAAAAPTYARATELSWAYTDSAHPGQSHVNPDWHTDLPVGTRVPPGEDPDTSRVYATFDLSPFLGTHLVSASIYAQEGADADCTNSAADIWATDAPTGKISWQNAPAEIAKIGSLHFGIGCPTDYLHADVGAAITAAVNAGQKSISIEVRVPAEHENDPSYAFTLYGYYGLVLDVGYNHPPTKPTGMQTNFSNCTTSEPYKMIGTLQPVLTATATDVDSDDQVSLTPTFEIWPTDHPDQKTTLDTPRFGGIRAAVPANLLTDGGSYAWHVQVTDGVDSSPWSDTCYFTVDVTRPSAAPGVDSPNYPQGMDHGIPGGAPMTFNFTPNGVADIAGYAYNVNNGMPAGSVPAGPDGSATVTLNPPYAGPIILNVYSYDAAGNTSPTTTYEFILNPTAPIVTTDPRLLLGKTFHINMSPNPAVAPVDYYEIRKNEGDWTRVDADSSGNAATTFETDQQNSVQFAIRSHSINGWISEPVNLYEYPDTSPIISSPTYPENATGGGVGVEGTFKFEGTVPNGASFTYSFDFGPESTVAADSNGNAQVSWTPDTPGDHILYAYETSADGTMYDIYYYFFTVAG